MKAQQANHARLAMSSSDTLQLPFFDDVSQSDHLPNPHWWEDEQKVTVRSGIDINSPSYQVMVFDGVDASGVPYNTNGIAYGPTDALTSKAIDLSQVLPADSTYLTFFLQPKGLANAPNGRDRLIISFLEKEGTYDDIWEIDGSDPRLSTQQFRMFAVKVDTAFLHEGFRFKIQAYGNQSGAFDNWLLNYVHLDQRRFLENPENPTVNDQAYVDRTLTKKPSSPFTPYTMIPMKQFKTDPDTFIQGSKVQAYNHNNQTQLVSYTFEVIDTIANQVIEQTNLNTSLGLINGFTFKDFESTTLDPDKLLAYNSDSLYLAMKCEISSNDTLLVRYQDAFGRNVYADSIDLKMNDTTVSYTVIDNILAYDDGEAEYAAGIAQQQGQLAYKFNVPTNDVLTAVQINWRSEGFAQGGQPITLKIWRDLNDDPIVTRTVTTTPGTLEQPFTTYNVGSVAVNGDIYVGYQQSSNDRIPVGLDKNHDAGDQMYFNTNGEWVQNQDVEGALMIRLQFLKSNQVPPLDNELPQIHHSFYPNPNIGKVYIDAELEGIQLFDVSGHRIQFDQHYDGHRTEIIFDNTTPGLYLIKYKLHGQWMTDKLIIHR
ncbi:T9SS type A sorting domain-containing protein [Persicobacter psychrovividus]|uniref:Secretion system C-terminal sorting domain-containing protein n=1 Tax=Persicobacter psychrovividus TaxID=387638 RepID=A0ABM7VD86_9BACT|nr:hypothetical protein PEPS_11740 [Persicobacter psychrovividus]